MSEIPEWSKNLRQHWADNGMPHPEDRKLAQIRQASTELEQRIVTPAMLRMELRKRDAERERAELGILPLTKAETDWLQEHWPTTTVPAKKEPAYTWPEFFAIVCDKWFFFYLSVFLTIVLFVV